VRNSGSALLGGYSADFSARNPDINETILDANGVELSFVIFFSGTNALVDGFTLTGANRTCTVNCQSYYHGGAIRVRGGAPTISHNRIQSNVAFARGGGIYVGQGASPTISANLIYSNTTDSLTDGRGGGIYVHWGTTVVITGNTIISNVAGALGGGIAVAGTQASVLNNTISFNQVVTTAGHGGGVIMIWDASGEVKNNTIGYNYSRDSGGGVEIRDCQRVTVTRNTVYANSEGGIQAFSNLVTTTIAHNEVYSNTCNLDFCSTLTLDIDANSGMWPFLRPRRYGVRDRASRPSRTPKRAVWCC
jgi:putative cofactor-binding repeat protein